MKYCEPTHPKCNVAAPEAKIPIKDVIITQYLLLQSVLSTLPPLQLTQLALLCAFPPSSPNSAPTPQTNSVSLSELKMKTLPMREERKIKVTGWFI